jgi:hypothetical protein
MAPQDPTTTPRPEVGGTLRRPAAEDRSTLRARLAAGHAGLGTTTSMTELQQHVRERLRVR